MVNTVLFFQEMCCVVDEGREEGKKNIDSFQVRVETCRETSNPEKRRKVAFTKAIGLLIGVEGEEKTGIVRPWKLAGRR